MSVSDVIAADGTIPQQRAPGERQAGCTTGTVTAAEYRQQLLAAGFTQITITLAGSSGDLLQPTIIQAVKPAAGTS